MDAARDEARDVGHVDQQQRADLVGDGAEAAPVDGAGVGAVAGDDKLGAVLLGEGLDLSVVDKLRLRVDAVGDDVVVLAGEVDGAAVGEVAAVVEAHAHEGLAGLHEGGVDGDVGLGAGVGLHVGMLRAEELLDAVDGEGLGHVDELAAAVVAAAGVALGVLVGHDGGGGLEDGLGGVVLGGDEDEGVLLACELELDGASGLGIAVDEDLWRGESGGVHGGSFRVGVLLCSVYLSGAG